MCVFCNTNPSYCGQGLQDSCLIFSDQRTIPILLQIFFLILQIVLYVFFSKRFQTMLGLASVLSCTIENAN